MTLLFQILEQGEQEWLARHGQLSVTRGSETSEKLGGGGARKMFTSILTMQRRRTNVKFAKVGGAAAPSAPAVPGPMYVTGAVITIPTCSKLCNTDDRGGLRAGIQFRCSWFSSVRFGTLQFCIRP